jgi:Flp pilus assembly protein TadG
MDKRGSTAAATALLASTLVGGAGLAVDSTRIWLVETRLRMAVDAAALAAARRLNDPNRNAEVQAVFAAHFNGVSGTAGYLGAIVMPATVASIEGDSSRVRVQGTATIPVSLFGVLSNTPVTRTEGATAQRAGQGLEVAIVLDQTSSMRSAASGGGTKLDAARAAVNAMLDVLYAGRDTQQNLWVSLVPFARTINIGTQNSAMLDTSSMPTGWSLDAWSGCVEARRSGHDTTDAAPTGPARFRPFFWPSTYRQVGTTATGRCETGNAYPYSGGVRYCHGDNDWGTGSSAPTQTELNANKMYDTLRDDGMTHADSVGPNLLCAQNPIQPLTASRATFNLALDAVTAPHRSGGTTTAVGLQGA